MRERSGDDILMESDFRTFAGRDLVQKEDSVHTYRGPIKRVSVLQDQGGESGRYVEFYLDWVAVETDAGYTLYQEPDDPDIGVKAIGINLNYSSVTETGEGVIGISIPYVGDLKVLKVGDNLDKESVQGLGIY